VVIAGGVVRGSDGGIVGEAAMDFIRQFKVDYAVIGASAIDHDGSLLDFDFREVKVAQAIIANARHVILVSDSDQIRAHRAGSDRHLEAGKHLRHRCLPERKRPQHLSGAGCSTNRNLALKSLILAAACFPRTFV
jgi:DeoR family glycerol-3-phosphate regulon repressor